MFRKFYPDKWVDSAYEIDYEELYRRGIRGLLFDIDNTLVPHGADADERAKELFGRLKRLGFHICLISNNNEERVRRFNRDIHVNYIHKANKPSVNGFRKAMERMHTTEKNTVFIGDQLFTDIYGAKRAGIYSYLVMPIDPKEEIQIILKRYLEKIVLHYYKKQFKKGSQEL